LLCIKKKNQNFNIFIMWRVIDCFQLTTNDYTRIIYTYITFTNIPQNVITKWLLQYTYYIHLKSYNHTVLDWGGYLIFTSSINKMPHVDRRYLLLVYLPITDQYLYIYIYIAPFRDLSSRYLLRLLSLTSSSF